MAQIRIEEKKSGSIFPWILGLLVLALAVWGISEVFEETDEEVAITEEAFEDVENVAAEPTKEAVYAYASDVEAYLEYTEDMDGEMGLDHEFSHRALSLLATAVANVANERGLDAENYEGKSNQVMRLADDITKDPYATDHADKIRMSALLITEMLEDIDGEIYAGRNAASFANLRAEAQAISSKTLTLNQKEDVRSFFAAAREVLDTMD